MERDSDSSDAKPSTSKDQPNSDKDSDNENILDDEPVVDRGLASALRLAVSKGYLVKEKKNARFIKTKAAIDLEAKNFTVEEKNYYDIDAKYDRNNRDRFSGPLTDFAEKKAYKPDVKLDYIDEKGHSMNEKEAFRYLSHRFHGKGSGKKKTEKRIRKEQESELMKKMSSGDTPLNTVSLLIEKQKTMQQAYVVLSAPKGGSKNDQ
jgi:U4/U6.U5 tri-snRNP-associated protein 1